MVVTLVDRLELFRGKLEDTKTKNGTEKWLLTVGYYSEFVDYSGFTVFDQTCLTVHDVEQKKTD